MQSDRPIADERNLSDSEDDDSDIRASHSWVPPYLRIFHVIASHQFQY